MPARPIGTHKKKPQALQRQYLRHHWLHSFNRLLPCLLNSANRSGTYGLHSLVETYVRRCALRWHHLHSTTGTLALAAV